MPDRLSPEERSTHMRRIRKTDTKLELAVRKAAHALGYRLRIHRLLVELARERDLAVVSVGHDLSLAARFADELVLLREGRVVAAGTPAEVLRPELLAETYGVRVRLIDDPEGGTPLVRAD